MHQFVARSNVDHYLELLRVEVVPETRLALNSLLIEEENKLGRTLEHLEFAEIKLTKYRQHRERLNGWRDGFADGSSERVAADNVILGFERTLQIVERFCETLRRELTQRPF